MPNLYDVLFTKKANKELSKLDPDARQQIIAAIEDLKREARPTNSRALRGELKGYWRLRSGDYRVIYQIKKEKLQIIVIRAGHRKDIYQ
jgi:mRNA interferase RelE/StbE